MVTFLDVTATLAISEVREYDTFQEALNNIQKWLKNDQLLLLLLHHMKGNMPSCIN